MTNLNHVANYCMDNPEHPVFRGTDGARCVKCRGMVNVKLVTKAQYNRLPTYQQLCNERKRPYQFKAQCLVCDHKDMVLHNSKEEYQEVTVCPKCNGAFVDTWKLGKYLNGNNNIKNLKVNITVNVDEERLSEVIGEFKKALFKCLNLTVGKDDVDSPSRLEGSD